MRVVFLFPFLAASIAGCIRLLEVPDAPFDAPSDTPADAPRRDTPRDAPRDVPGAIDAGWAIPPGVPGDCRVERAMHPERLPGLTWESCGEGCSRADLGTIWNAVKGFVVDGDVWFELLSDDFGVGDTDALVPGEGPVLDAWRYRRTGVAPVCTMYWYDVHEGRAAALVAYFGDDESRVIQDQFWTYDLATGPEYGGADIVLAAPMVGNTVHTQEFVVSPALLASRIGGGRIVLSHGGELREIFPSTATQGGYDLGVLGDHLTFLDAAIEHRLMQWTPERGIETLYDPVEPLEGLRQDGSTLAWVRLMEFVDGLATRAELWTGELVRDPALFAPRLVNDRVLPNGVLGGGMYGWRQHVPGGSAAHLIDLDTGRHRILTSAPGAGCSILYVSREEVALSCSEPDGRSIYRYDPDVHAVDAPPL